MPPAAPSARPAPVPWSLAGAAVASTLGLGVSLYLAWLGAASAGAQPGAALWCGPGSSCQQVWSSPFARMWGVSLAWWGAAGYALILALVLATAWGRGGRAGLPLAVALSWAAAGFSVYLVGVQALVVRGVCPWCLISAACALAAAALISIAATRHPAGVRPRGFPANRPGTRAASPGPSRRSHPPAGREDPGRARPDAGAGYGRWRGGRWAAPAGAGLAVVLAAFNWAQATRDLSASGWEQTASPGGTAAVVSTQPRNLTELSARMAAGPVQAAARVDVFSDFQCPYCALAARDILTPLLQQDVAEGRMRLTFFNFAFIGAESKRAAEAAVCAALQDRFWSYHDRLFAIQGRENSGIYTRERLVQLAQQEGLDLAAFTRCLGESWVRRLVEASYELGRSLGVRGTPAFVVNGRLLEGLVPLAVLRRAAYGD